MGIMQKLRRMEKKKNDHGGTRTHNLWIRSPTRYPLRHMTGSETIGEWVYLKEVRTCDSKSSYKQRISYINYSTLSKKIHFFSTFPFNICRLLISLGLILSRNHINMK